MQTYAVGDIHGQRALLEQAHELIAADRAANGEADAPVVHVGDVVDRGPDSRGSIAFLMQGQAAGAPWLVLKGNHDRMFEGFLADPWQRDPGLRAELSWLHPRLGGPQTLESYGLRKPADRPVDQVHAEALAAVPQAHRDWLAGLPLYHLRGQALFVHAGIRPGVDLAAQREHDLLWIRADFLEDTRDHGALVVHGHTAIDAARHHGNRLNIDSSAGYGGPVSAVVIEGRDAWLLTPAGRVPLLP
ncbi:MAG: metallophosphoesterase [Phaeovulum sp.]|jgi:serine/threonine protein phosphatase 1|uniref:metallophosphoesterase n=1 Tax=Phaeovulum sp. TaxID=2934796 RepID=UPI0027300CE2|nr:metallophosphoesterase [Phaeovulum sp.]MDP2061535.1 metallophosphoesterase [Phaeovulum sp.]MDP3861221.1 metallophosphoesterase [Phaeovulum sp.]